MSSQRTATCGALWIRNREIIGILVAQAAILHPWACCPRGERSVVRSELLPLGCIGEVSVEYRDYGN